MTTDGTNMYMPVAPAYGMGGGGGFGNFGGDGWWIILLLLVFGGWGNGFGGNGGGGGFNGLYPWLNNTNQMNEGFQNQLLNDNITSIRDGVTGIGGQLCNGFAGVNATVANGFAQAEIAANGRQMADMNQTFALQSQLSQCCCDNRLATVQTQNIVATENAATRAAIQQQTQAILDKMCQQEIDAKNETISQLRQELMFARGQASQDVQTAALRAGQVAEVDALYERLNACPVATVPVYGRQPIFTAQNAGCGCMGG